MEAMYSVRDEGSTKAWCPSAAMTRSASTTTTGSHRAAGSGTPLRDLLRRSRFVRVSPCDRPEVQHPQVGCCMVFGKLLHRGEFLRGGG